MQHFPAHNRWPWLPALLALIACGASSAQAPGCPADGTRLVSASNLRRTHIVNAVYPTMARENRVEGWVEVAFTIQPDGSTTDLDVQNASPAGVFDESAIAAIAQWRYEPLICYGQPVLRQRAMVRIKFSL